MSTLVRDPERPRARHRLAAILLMLALVAGVALRVAYPTDIEFKADERWSFEETRIALGGGPWPTLGLPTSIGGRQPGLSVWVFIGLAWISGADTPPELARAVEVTNGLALLALALFAWTSVPWPSREAWLWAVGLWAVNPIAVIYERKIWPQSVLPLLAVGLIAAWWHRRRWIASLLFGVIAALMSQLHVVAALWVVALLVWGLLEDRRSFRWSGLLLGGVAGALPAVPWFLSLLRGAGSPQVQWRAVPLLYFYPRWVLQPFGFSVAFTLGKRQLLAFLRWPVIGGVPTFLSGVAHIALAAAMFILFAKAFIAFRTRPRPHLGAVFVGEDPTGRLIRATFWGYGGLLSLFTLTGAGAERHYMIFIAPVMALWVARLAAYPANGQFTRTARTLLAVCCVGQVLVSALALNYIHHVQVFNAPYGATWSAQQRGLAPSPPITEITTLGACTPRTVATTSWDDVHRRNGSDRDAIPFRR